MKERQVIKKVCNAFNLIVSQVLYNHQVRLLVKRYQFAVSFRYASYRAGDVLSQSKLTK